MVSPPSKLQMFTGGVCVLLTSVSLKSIKIINLRNHEFVRKKNKQTNKQTKWRVKGKWPRLILFFFFWSELIRVQFYILFLFLYSIPVDPTRTGGPDFCTCLAKMFVCPVPKISHVMMKWCRRASHLGRFTLWNNGRRATQLGRFTLWHYGRLATQLSRFTLWHNGRRAKQPGLMHAPGVARIFQRKIWRLNPK